MNAFVCEKLYMKNHIKDKGVEDVVIGTALSVLAFRHQLVGLPLDGTSEHGCSCHRSCHSSPINRLLAVRSLPHTVLWFLMKIQLTALQDGD